MKIKRQPFKLLGILLALLLTTFAIAEEMVQVARCDESGECVITQDMLRKLMQAVVYWHDKAQTCKGV